MLKNLRKKLTVLALSLGMILAPVAIPVAAYAAEPADDGANIRGNLECGTTLSVDDPGAECSDEIETGTGTINTGIRNVINIFSAIIGIIAVVMIIYGGLKYISSGGDSGNVTAAKNTIIYAVIGLIIVAMAQFIVQFVLGRIIPAGD
jgi:hypothetical protein